MRRTKRSSPAGSALPEIECIELLENIEEAYAREYGVAPFNISHWDPTEEFETAMLPHLDLPSLSSAIAYRFSYQVAETEAVIAKFGASTQNSFGVFTPSTTTSILCVLNWLRSRARQRIVAVCPAYFSLFHAADRFGIATQKIFLRRSAEGFWLKPAMAKMGRKPGVLWLTNPVYGAGVYFGDDDVAFIDQLLVDGWTVIADECLALPGRELVRRLG
ncbi:MAG: hypothetical protein HZA32_16790 [Opitutae bacterium]|nr:hypothetical protein [Opitutae bacterium]